jgi:hypothetical protein
VEVRLLDRLRSAGRPLREVIRCRVFRGVTTGLNEAFIVDDVVRRALIAADRKAGRLLKPYLGGRDIQRWLCAAAKRWLIFARRGVDIDEVPTIRDHLKRFRPRLLPGGPGGRKPGSYEWYEIQDTTAYWREFEKPKLLSTKMSIRPTFAVDTSGCFPGNTAYVVPASEQALFLAAILNSRVFLAYARRTFVDKRNGWYEVQPDALEAFPVPEASRDQRAKLENVVKAVVSAKLRGRANRVQALEREIDERVYRLYGLTEDEIKLVEEDR